MGKFISFVNDKILPIFTNISVPSIILLVIIAVAFFFLYNLLDKNNAYKITVVFFIYAIVLSVLAIALKFSRMEFLTLLIAFIVCIVVMFSTEIKRSVWNRKNVKFVTGDVANTIKNNSKNVTNYINEIIKALLNMSKNDVGAIIVLSNTKIPSSVIDTGVKLDSDISSALIESIFSPKTPLHDGAVIIQNDKIQAAGCFLPLSQETDLPKELGTRHRAGIGVTEMLNATALIVSEETGIISIAKGGKITRYADTEALRAVLREYYWQDILNGNTKNTQNR